MNPLERLRIDARLTREQLANGAGVPEHYLWRLETDRIGRPDPQRLGDIADFLAERLDRPVNASDLLSVERAA